MIKHIHNRPSYGEGYQITAISNGTISYKALDNSEYESRLPYEEFEDSIEGHYILIPYRDIFESIVEDYEL